MQNPVFPQPHPGAEVREAEAASKWKFLIFNDFLLGDAILLLIETAIFLIQKIYMDLVMWYL